MKRRDFERLVDRAVTSIPEEFLAKIDNLTFQVENWPDGETLAEAGVGDPRDLLGFYRGWPLSERSHDLVGVLPDVISIFQGPIENHVRETGESLLRVIRETVIHELAHHFGFSEEEMEAIERRWAGEDSRET